MNTPEQIVDNAPKDTRLIRVEANVIAYFGDFFHAWKEGVRRSLSGGPVTSAQTAPTNTASADSQS
jgi:hypothetical protein